MPPAGAISMSSTLPPTNRNPDILFAALLAQAKTVRAGFDVERVRRAWSPDGRRRREPREESPGSTGQGGG